MAEYLYGNHKVIFGDAVELELASAPKTYIDSYGREVMTFNIRLSDTLIKEINEKSIDPNTGCLPISILKIQTISLCQFSQYSRLLVMTTYDGRATPLSLKFATSHSKVLELQKSLLMLEKSIAVISDTATKLLTSPLAQLEYEVRLFEEMNRLKKKEGFEQKKPNIFDRLYKEGEKPF
jgi:hypothetical protein